MTPNALPGRGGGVGVLHAVRGGLGRTGRGVGEPGPELGEGRRRVIRSRAGEGREGGVCGYGTRGAGEGEGCGEGGGARACAAARMARAQRRVWRVRGGALAARVAHAQRCVWRVRGGAWPCEPLAMAFA